MEHKHKTPNIIFGSGVSSPKGYENLLAVAQEAVQNGCRGFDTAPSYKTEVVLGKVIRECMLQNNLSRKDFFIQSKVDGWQMQEGHISKYITTALNEMEIEYFDSLLVHWPMQEYFDKTWESLLQIQKEGKVKDIGICNVRLRHLKAFADKGILPKYIQIERHPLMIFEKEIEFCKANNIIVQVYSPLCKMHPHLKESQKLKMLAEKYNKNIGQIILRWQIDTGVVPVFTSTKPERVKSNLDIFDFILSEEDIAIVSSLNENYKLCLESIACPGF